MLFINTPGINTRGREELLKQKTMLSQEQTSLTAMSKIMMEIEESF